MPSVTIEVTSADPPDETSGSGTPITGSMPMTAPTLTSIWPISQAIAPAVAIRTNRSSLRVTSRRHAYPITRNKPRTTRVPGRPSSSPTMAKMKSLCASGSHDHFSRLAPRPTPHQPPSASAYLPWMACQQVSSLSSQVLPFSQAPTRTLRLALVSTSAATSIAISAPAERNIRAGAPAANNSAPKMSSRIIAVPRSRPASTSTRATAPTGNSSGTAACTQLSSNGRLRTSTAAPHTTRASLSGSAGCSLRPATPIQLRLPLTSTPSGLNTNSWATTVTTTATHPSRFQTRRGSREAATISGSPNTANTSWLRKTVNTEPLLSREVTADAENTMTSPITSSSRVAPSSR